MTRDRPPWGLLLLIVGGIVLFCSYPFQMLTLPFTILFWAPVLIVAGGPVVWVITALTVYILFRAARWPQL